MSYKRSRNDFEADLQKRESPFVLYGTPLPPLDEDSRDDGSYVPVWKQEVTDDRGRKRLHGAFTGGFSAGYFNTVGSKEGWAPSTFVSSRSNRAKDARTHTQQKAEDFMDEEDLREQEESKYLSTNEGFAGFGTADDTNIQNTLLDIFRPAEDSMGQKLLTKMGWKKGHGIGPKVKRKIDPEDPASETHAFAPEDVPMLSFEKKTDYKGLGYNSETGTSRLMQRASSLPRKDPNAPSDEEDEARPGLSFAARAKKPTTKKRGAFGVGILNDTGSDDEDPYSMGPQISYNKTLGGDKKLKKSKISSGGNANPLLKKTPTFISGKLSSMSKALKKCHDGKLPLDGFVLADDLDGFSNMSLDDNESKPPPVPDGWTPSRLSSVEKPTDISAYQSTVDVAKSSSHTSSTRGTMLGETALPGKSVFDYLTPAIREKLMKATGKTNLPPALSEPLPGATSTTNAQTHDPEILQLDPQTALQALSRMLSGGFTPYRDDPAKAVRYKLYLESQANSNTDTTRSSSLPLRQPQTMTKSDFHTELHEFARAAEVFKPVSGLMASRFTTSTSTPTSNPSTDQPNTTATTDASLADLLTKPPSRAKDPAEEAAAMGMFGPLTRSVTSFFPTRLVCKRFGVAMPNLADTAGHTTTTTTTGSYATAGGYGDGDKNNGNRSERFQSAGSYHEGNVMDTTGFERVGENLRASTTSKGQVLAIEGANAFTVGQVDTLATEAHTAAVNPDRNEALEQERPGAAVFKAIFGSDDEDD